MYRDWACNIHQIALVQPLIITNSFRHMPTDGCQSDQFLFRKCHDDRLRVDPSQFVAQWWEKTQAAQVMTCWFSSTKARANGFCFRMSLGKASVKETKIRPRRFKVSEVSSARMFNQRPVLPASVRTNKYMVYTYCTVQVPGLNKSTTLLGPRAHRERYRMVQSRCKNRLWHYDYDIWPTIWAVCSQATSLS